MNLLTVFEQGDAILIAVFLILIAMSVLTWTLIVTRGLMLRRTRLANRAAETALWAAKDWQSAQAQLAEHASPVAALTHDGLAALRHYREHASASLGQSCDLNEFLTRAIRRGLSRETGKLESGMTMLASVGSTAPFIGLFGTVWGIYHALVNIGAAGQVNIATVSGPIGEALVATAAGLAAAIPAVLAYNAFTRVNRVIGQDLDHFAHDLHAQLLTQAEAIDGVR
ncbi:outer membrane transport energization protein ExbB [Crenobacter luteus]|uniref:Biopolymer transport protein ExbB n=1 Tax=Crenobacter luteus TaxID=1452487 RepID=A0A165F1N1_9NEIS|nr:MotA/TolQ/ExbB proton channel family protein [Crenobacter luteus]KZE29781.1 biopolymer transporter ExbB [Crenobacter luteus]TCP08414.1 outer membrane transport energization protein ExbB [Crenobacter luteus]